MTDLIERARAWAADDPDPGTREELLGVVDSGDLVDLQSRMDTVLTFGTAGIRGEVGAGPGRMNRAVVIRTTHGLAGHLGTTQHPVIVGFDARPSSRRFAEDTAGVLAAAGVPVLYFPEVTPTPLVAYAAKHLGAASAVVITASHNPPADNGYKVYGPEASQIVPPADIEIQAGMAAAPPADQVPRLEDVFAGTSDLVRPVPDDIFDCYWEEVATIRCRQLGSNLRVVYTPLHGVGGQTLLRIMDRAGHTGIEPVPEQFEPDGTFPTVAFPNPEEPGALDLALAMARQRKVDLIVANDPDADRLAVVIPHRGTWRPLSGNEVGTLLADYVLSHDPDPATAIVSSSIVSSPMLGLIAAEHGAKHEQTLTGFKWIVKAGLTLEARGEGRFVFGYEEALGYTIGPTVRDKDGLSAALVFTDLAADCQDDGGTVMGRLHALWRRHRLWVSTQTSVVRPGPTGVQSLLHAVERLAERPPDDIDGIAVTGFVDYREGAESRPEWLGEQALVEMTLGTRGRILVRPSGTEPKLKIYVDLCDPAGDDPDGKHQELVGRANGLGSRLAKSMGL